MVVAGLYIKPDRHVCRDDSINLITGITKSVSRVETRVYSWQLEQAGPLDMVDGTRGVKFVGFPMARFGRECRTNGSCRWLPSKASNRYSFPLRSTPLRLGVVVVLLSSYLLNMLHMCVYIRWLLLFRLVFLYPSINFLGMNSLASILRSKRNWLLNQPCKIGLPMLRP